ncbi:MAG: periplasmic heavy metal sensor [Rectinema sp.]|nr:periplasmic heavy metal sensor [Rectinema sp.]
MKTSRKAITLLMAGAMLVAATAGVFAQGFGRAGGPGVAVPGYGFKQTAPAAKAAPGGPVFGYGPQFNARNLYVYQNARGARGSSRMGFMGRIGSMGAGGYGALHYLQYQKLSAEDKAKVDKIIQDTAAQLLPLQTELRTLRLSLNSERWAANPDKAKIDAAIAKIAELQKQIQEIRTSKILEINKIFQSVN